MLDFFELGFFSTFNGDFVPCQITKNGHYFRGDTIKKRRAYVLHFWNQVTVHHHFFQ